MEWRLDDSRITLGRGGMLKVKLAIDDTATAILPADVAGSVAIPWRGKSVELRRVGPRSGLESLLFVNDELVAPSTDGPLRGPKERCGPHGKASTRRCPACEAVLCPRCRSVDGVRCVPCLEEAAQRAGDTRKRNWLLGAGLLLLVAVGAFGLAFATHTRVLAKIAGACLVGAVGMAWAAFRIPKGAAGLLLPMAFELDDAPPQIAGQRCGACKERIGVARDGERCERCRKVLHHGCRDGHRCRRPKRGPDWDALPGR